MILGIALAVFGILWISFIHLRRNDRKLPPGPRALPIIGNIHMLGNQPHHSLRRLSQKYGPIMSMRLGHVLTVVVSSPEAAELVFKTHDAVFANRPKVQVADYYTYGSKGIVMTEYGSYWRSVRRLCTLKLLTTAKVNSFAGMRREEVGSLVRRFKEAAAAGKVVDVSAEVVELIEHITCRMILGRSKDERFELVKVITETADLLGEPNINDYLPYLRFLDLQGITRRIKVINKEFDKILETIIDEHVIQRDNHGDIDEHNFTDELLSLMNKPINDSIDNSLQLMDRPNIKAILKDLLGAGIETSSTAINWVMAELMRHPRVMRELQNELKSVVGMERMVEEIDLPKLAYLDKVVKEGLRLHPPGPLLAPHKSLKDITIDGYYIPKGTTVIINAWAIGRDLNVWTSNADEFFPERFKDDNVDVQWHDFRLIPFGSGRRGCIGMRLALLTVQLVVAHLMHCFDWELPDGMVPGDLDMSEKPGGQTTPRNHHLLALPNYRLKCA